MEQQYLETHQMKLPTNQEDHEHRCSWLHAHYSKTTML